MGQARRMRMGMGMGMKRVRDEGRLLSVEGRCLGSFRLVLPSWSQPYRRASSGLPLPCTWSSSSSLRILLTDHISSCRPSRLLIPSLCLVRILISHLPNEPLRVINVMRRARLFLVSSIHKNQRPLIGVQQISDITLNHT